MGVDTKDLTGEARVFVRKIREIFFATAKKKANCSHHPQGPRLSSFG
jgi:hypothetical protein